MPAKADGIPTSVFWKPGHEYWTEECVGRRIFLKNGVVIDLMSDLGHFSDIYNDYLKVLRNYDGRPERDDEIRAQIARTQLLYEGGWIRAGGATVNGRRA